MTLTFAQLDEMAAEASETAARLEAERAERQARRDKAAWSAEVAFWAEEERSGVKALRDARDAAEAHWVAVAEDPTSSVDALLDAFVRAQKAAEVYMYEAAVIWGRMDQIDPLPEAPGGYRTRRPHPWFSVTQTSFADALSGVAKLRQAKLADDTAADREVRLSAAVSQGIKAVDQEG